MTKKQNKDTEIEDKLKKSGSIYMSDEKTQKLKELFGGLFAKLMEFSIEQEFLNS